MYDDELIRPWYEGLPLGLSEIPRFDIHTHTGSNDPDGFVCSAEDVVANLTTANSRGMVTPMHEPLIMDPDVGPKALSLKNTAIRAGHALSDAIVNGLSLENPK